MRIRNEVQICHRVHRIFMVEVKRKHLNITQQAMVKITNQQNHRHMYRVSITYHIHIVVHITTIRVTQIQIQIQQHYIAV